MTNALLAFLLLAAPPAGSAEVARSWLDLMVAGKVPEAAKLVASPGGAKVEQDLKMMKQSMFAAQGPVKKLELGETLFSAEDGDSALAIVTRVWTVDPKNATTVRMKKEYATDMAEYFPADQLVAAKKVIRWDGDRYMNLSPVWLVRVGGTWKVDLKGPAPDKAIASFRGQLRKKFGANLLRYANEDMGVPGCRDPNDPSRGAGCYPGETGETAATPAPGGNCVLASGAPCGKDQDCYWTEADDPVPCKKGQKGCVTMEGDDCSMK